MDVYGIIPNNGIVVEGFVEESSVTVKNEDDTVSVWVVESEDNWFKQFFIERYQVNTLRKLGCKSLSISQEKIENDLKNYYTRFWYGVQNYKKELTMGQIYHVRKSSLSEITFNMAFASILAFMFSIFLSIGTGKELGIAVIISIIINYVLYQLEVMCTKLDNIPAVVYMSSFRYATILLVIVFLLFLCKNLLYRI